VPDFFQNEFRVELFLVGRITGLPLRGQYLFLVILYRFLKILLNYLE
jgi:hypothetical protein